MKVLIVIKKDLKVILSDKKALAIMILMPVILTTILSMALKGSFADGNDVNIDPVNIAVVKGYDEKQDASDFEAVLRSSFFSDNMEEKDISTLLKSGSEINEKMFFDDFLDSENLYKFIRYRVEEEGHAMELLKSKEVSAVVVLPNRFIYDMKINFLTPLRNKIDIKILTHPDRSIDGQIVKAAIDAYANAMSTVIIGKNVILETAMSNDMGSESMGGMEKLMDGISDILKSVKISMDEDILEGKKSVSSADYYAAGMMTMFILFAAGHGGRMLLEEKDQLTYQRMMAAGVDKFEVVTGKLVTIFIIALFQTSIMIVYSHFALKVQWGNFIAVSLISISSALSVAGLGSFIGALTYRAGNYKMANIFESAIIQVMALLGGSFFPLDVMPEFMRKLSFLSLNGIALKSYLRVITGGSVGDVLSYIYILIIIGALFAALSIAVLSIKEVSNHVKHNKATIFKA